MTDIEAQIAASEKWRKAERTLREVASDGKSNVWGSLEDFLATPRPNILWTRGSPKSAKADDTALLMHKERYDGCWVDTRVAVGRCSNIGWWTPTGFIHPDDILAHVALGRKE